MFWSWIKFYDEQWNFDNRKLLKLLEMAKRAKKTEVKSRSWLRWDIVLFWWVSKKEVWQFINRFSIFINSGLDEKTGLLWKILNDLDKNLLESLELKSKIKWAMIYPIILLFLTIAMVTGMMVFIVPRIAWAFAQQWVELPWMTRAVIAVSNFIQNDYMIILLSLVWLYVVYKIINATYQWKYMFSRLAMMYPVFGFIVRQSNVIYFIKSFSTLLDSWVLLLESIKTSSRVVPNLAYKREIVRIKNEVEFWLTISRSIWLNLTYEDWVYLNKYFPEEFAYIVSTWEETWTLSESIKKMWVNYNKELKRYISNLSTMIEPFIIVVVWAMVGTIVIAIMLPFFQLWKVVQNM